MGQQGIEEMLHNRIYTYITHICTIVTENHESKWQIIPIEHNCSAFCICWKLFLKYTMSVILFNSSPPSAVLVNRVSIHSHNGLSSIRPQAIIQTNAWLLSIRPSGINLVKFKSKFKIFHSRKCIWKCCLPKPRPFCPGKDELKATRKS